MKGVVTIGRATDERDVTRYALYWAKSPRETLAKIGEVAATEQALTIALEGAVPEGATMLVARSANDAGERTTGATLADPDNYPRFVDIAADGPEGSGFSPALAVDAKGKRIFVASMDFSRTRTPSLTTCTLDGTGCVRRDASGGQGENSGAMPKIAFDEASGKVLVVTQNGANSGRPGLFRCDAGGATCTFVDISTGVGGAGLPSGADGAVLVDRAGKKLLAVTNNYSAGTTAYLFRCELDGTACAAKSLAADQGEASGRYPSPAIDEANKKLLVATTNATGRLSLFRCGLDGSSCVHHDVSAGQPENSGVRPSLVIDAKNKKLLIVATSEEKKARLTRCELDGSKCTHHDVSAGGERESGLFASAVVDEAHDKLLVATTDQYNDEKVRLARCNLDGTACTAIDLSAGQGTGSGYEPKAAIADGKLLVVTQNGALADRISLYTLRLF